MPSIKIASIPLSTAIAAFSGPPPGAPPGGSPPSTSGGGSGGAAIGLAVGLVGILLAAFAALGPSQQPPVSQTGTGATTAVQRAVADCLVATSGIHGLCRD